MVGDVALVADAALSTLGRLVRRRAGARPELRARIAAEGRWRDVPYVDDAPAGTVDPRTLSIALDDLLPAERTVVVDSGNFMGYPSMFLSVPDSAGFCFTQAFQSIGLGLASALGAAVARPDRLTVAALGDGGFLMSAAELATAVRLGAAAAWSWCTTTRRTAPRCTTSGRTGIRSTLVRLPGHRPGRDRPRLRLRRASPCASPADLAPLRDWLAGPRDRPLVVDAKVSAVRGSWWLEEAFRGH